MELQKGLDRKFCSYLKENIKKYEGPLTRVAAISNSDRGAAVTSPVEIGLKNTKMFLNEAQCSHNETVAQL